MHERVNDTILQKVSFAQLKMVTQNIRLVDDNLSPTICQLYPDSQIAIRIFTGQKQPNVKLQRSRKI